jgi:hypothetical protein
MMDEPVNPYASPEANLSESPFAEPILADLPGLRTTGIGLSLVYYGIIVMLLTVIFMFFSAFVVPAFPTLGVSFLVIPGILVLICAVVIFAGQVTCLAVPSQTGAKVYIILAVVLQVLSIVQYALSFIAQRLPGLSLPQPIMTVFDVISSTHILFFVLFMRAIGKYLGRQDIVDKARNVIIVGAILVVAAVAVAFTTTPSQKDAGPSIAVVIGFLFGCLIAFVMYVNLINAVRQAILKRRPQWSSSAGACAV